MLDKNHEEKIISEILKEKVLEKDFEKIIGNSNIRLHEMDIFNKAICIKEYFGNGMGKISAKNKLLKDKIIEEEWLNKDTNDFKGLYVFIHNDRPIYIGISKGVIGRIIQHIKGKNHFQATLAYNIAKIYYKIVNNCDFNEKRESFDFKKYVNPIKEFLMNQKITFIHIKNDEELYLFEIFCSMKFKTILNSFETH